MKNLFISGFLAIFISNYGYASELVAAKSDFKSGLTSSLVIRDAEQQTNVMLQEASNINKSDPALVSPRSVESTGALKMVKSSDWTSGFFAGKLWLLYESTKDKKWETQAKLYTSYIESEQYNGASHDVGFKVYTSFGNGYRLTGNPHYRDVIIQAAKTLATRFSPIVGCTRSWSFNTDEWEYPVVIDNMMNLELLFAASQISGDPTYYNIAVSHADTTLKNHFRSDYSSYHVVDYEESTGNVRWKGTYQGYSDDSAWSRGQAWGVYGYTMSYRFTKDKKYLAQAEHIAEFIINDPNMPSDMVPYWDFDAPNIPNEERDASAAAVIASGLYELSEYSENRKKYIQVADQIMLSLTNNYRSPLGMNHGFILLHSTGSKPANTEVDVPLTYADYYYLEALERKNKLKKI